MDGLLRIGNETPVRNKSTVNDLQVLNPPLFVLFSEEIRKEQSGHYPENITLEPITNSKNLGISSRLPAARPPNQYETIKSGVWMEY